MKRIFLFSLAIVFLMGVWSCNNDTTKTSGQNQQSAQTAKNNQSPDKGNVSQTKASQTNASQAKTQAAKTTKPNNKTQKQQPDKKAQQQQKQQKQQKQQPPQRNQQQQKQQQQRRQSQQPATDDEGIVIGNEVGNDIGDFEDYSPDSTVLRLSELRGKLTMVLLWNSKCSHCVNENKKFRAAYEKYHDKQFVNGDGFEIYAIGLDKLRDTWVEALEKQQYPWKYNVYVIDSWKDRNIRFFGIKNLPGTFLIDEDGIILAKKFDGNELTEMLEGYLKK